MKTLIALAMVLSTSAAWAQSELDNEAQLKNRMERPANLPATIILRVNEKTKEVQVVHMKNEVAADKAQAAEVSKLAFQNVSAEKKYAQSEFPELDQDRAVESWYFWYGYTPYAYYGWNSYYYPYYSYYGTPYAYYPYYNYNYYGYNYYYYRPYYGYGYYWW
jgi:hypothetical protein